MGPSIGDVADVLRVHTARPAESLARLRDWQILNCLIGKLGRSTARNLALMYAPGPDPSPTLAPFL